MWKNPKLIDKWFSAIPPDARRAARVLQALAETRSIPLYLVGGPLRDLLLGHPSLDLDLVIEGDAPALARDVALSLGAHLKLHPAFGTATIRDDAWHIDVATARRETYRRPGALPDVTPASLDEDLGRRDFTVNAMALRLDGPDTGLLLDPFGGNADLRAGLIRALHERTFEDDATRILRAARYEARLGFQIEPGTLGWLRRDAGFLNTISGARLHHEFSRIFREGTPERALARLAETGALQAIHPAITFGPEQASALAWLRGAHPHGLAAACWPLLAHAASEAEAAAISRRLALTNAQAAKARAMPELRSLLGRLEEPRPRRSELVDLLGPFPLPAIWAFAALHPGVIRRRCRDYIESAHTLKPLLRGDDVIALGVPRGPDVGDVLRRLRTAKLDGEVKTRRDEERFVRSMLAGAVTQ
jgi:tRNA nucleotidyltransferase (CCA-adding enzyme)